MKKLLQVAIAMCFVLGTAQLAFADHDETGGVINSRAQSLTCLSINDDTNNGTITQTFHGPNGEVLKTKTHNNVPRYGIRSLTYGGGKSPVSCRDADDGNDGISINVFDSPDRRVVAVQGNSDDNGEVALLNVSKQYPVCLGYCDRNAGCTIRLRWYDKNGDKLMDRTWNNVPDDGVRSLTYAGGASPVWCRDAGSTSTDSNVALVDKVTGNVDVSHSNDDD